MVSTAAKEKEAAQQEHSVSVSRNSKQRGSVLEYSERVQKKNYEYLCPLKIKKAEPMDNTAQRAQSMEISGKAN